MYVLVITIGQVPIGAESLELTVKLASAVQLSDMAGFPVKASNAATVVTAAGTSAAVQPSMVCAVSVPVMVGDVVSFTIIVWVTWILFPLVSVI